VALGLAITSGGLEKKMDFAHSTEAAIREHFPIFKHLLPSFCKTASGGNYRYEFFMAHDATDVFFRNATNRRLFSAVFDAMVGSDACEGTMLWHWGEDEDEHMEEQEDGDGTARGYEHNTKDAMVGLLTGSIDIEGLLTGSIDIEGLLTGSIDIEGLLTDRIDIEGLLTDSIDIEGLLTGSIDID
jgi:hypothetical protein